MTLPRSPLLAALLLTDCGPGADERSAEPEQRASTAPAPTAQVASPAVTPETWSLAGEYRVAGVDGDDLNAPTGHAVSITEDTIEFMRCAGFAWTYNFEDGALETRRIPVSPDEIVCLPTPEAHRTGVALAEATRVRRTSANGLEFSGGGHSVLLFSQ